MENAIWNFISANVKRVKCDSDTMRTLDIRELLKGAKILDIDFINWPCTDGITIMLEKGDDEIITLDIEVPESILMKMDCDELRAVEVLIGRDKARWKHDERRIQ